MSAVVTVTCALLLLRRLHDDVSRRPRTPRPVCDDGRVRSVEDRDRARDHVLGLAETDRRVVAAAVVGGLADGGGDRWSDLDLTFAVENGVRLAEVLEDWTRAVADGLGAVISSTSGRRGDLPRLPAAGLPPGRPLLRARVGVRGAWAEIPAPVRYRGRPAAGAADVGERAVRDRRPPRGAGALLDRARPQLASGALDQRRARAGAAARLPAPRARGELAAASTSCRGTSWRRARRRSSAHSGGTSSYVRSRVRSRCCSRSRRRPPTSPAPSRRSFRRCRRAASRRGSPPADAASDGHTPRSARSCPQ